MEGSSIDIWTIILSSGPVVKGVLILLFTASIVSWAIIIRKKFLFTKVENNNDDFMKIFDSHMSLKEIEASSERLGISTFKLVFSKGHGELAKINTLLHKNNYDKTHTERYFKDFGIGALDRALSDGINTSNTILENNLQTLASIGSVSPFVGLFGTVWGIINSFKGLSSGNATLDAVAPGIAEALVATAIGLAAAIPALWFYNSFITKQGKINSDMENFSKRFLNKVERTLIKNKQE